MPTSLSTVFFAYPFLDPFLPVDTLFLLPTVNRNPHRYIHHGPWCSWTAAPCHSTTPPEISRPISAIARPLEPRPYLPYLFAGTSSHLCRAESYVFFLRPIWWGAAVSPPKGKEIKQGEGKHLLAPRNAAACIGAATIFCCIICFCPLLCLPGRQFF